MNVKPIKPYNLTKEFIALVKPHIDSALKACDNIGLPMFFVACVEVDSGVGGKPPSPHFKSAATGREGVAPAHWCAFQDLLNADLDPATAIDPEFFRQDINNANN